MYNYRMTPADAWTGRTDSLEDFAAFRLHQAVERINFAETQALKHYVKKGLNFAFVGFESDLGVRLNKGRPGAAAAPHAIRQKLASLPLKFADVGFVDVGNIYATDDLTRAQKALGEIVAQLLQEGFLPIILGGGHETALASYYGHWFNKEASLGIVNIDAHFDNRPYEADGPTSGTMFRQIYDMTESQDWPYAYFVLGIQDHGNTQELFNFADETGTVYFSAQDLLGGQSNGIYDVLDSWLADLAKVHLTIDMDVFNVALAPGVSATQPFGIFPQDIMPYLTHLLKSGKVASIDVVEVSPENDQANGQTAQLAAVLLYYLMQIWAEVEQGKDA